MATKIPFDGEFGRQHWLDQEDAWMRETVRRCGFAVQAVFGARCWSHPGCGCGQRRGTRPPIAYTVGLYGFGHPEVVIVGLCIDTAATVLNDLGERIRHGRSLAPGDVLSFNCWPHRMHLVEFRDDGDVPVLTSAQRFYQRTQADPVPALQAVWGAPPPPAPLVSLPQQPRAPYYGLDL